MKILIALSTGKSHPEEFYMHLARETYLQKLLKKNHKPIFVSCFFGTDYAREFYEKADAVLFMGGGDFDPKLYGNELHPKSDISNPQQDKFELEILSWVLKDKKPFLGICRGAQALGIACGGTLIQHIDDIFEKKGITDEHHGLSEGGRYSDLAKQIEEGNGHEVLIDKNSSAFKILGEEKLMLNTGHHQSVKTVGSNFRISATTKHGITEVIESIDPNHFCFGIQGHPEAIENSKWEKFFEFKF